MTYTCACWRCRGKAHNDGTLHRGDRGWAMRSTAHGTPGAAWTYSCDPLRPPETDEATCQRCGGPNVWSWHAPSPLWNAVMRQPDGTDRWSIVCPPCFASLAEAAGIGQVMSGVPRLIWHFGPDNLDVRPLWTDADGRTWDPVSCLWVPAEPWAPPDEPGHVTPVGGWILVALLILGVLVAVIWRVLR